MAYIRNLYPHWGPKNPGGVQSILYECMPVSLYLFPVVSLSSRLCHFLAIIRASHNCVQSMRTQGMGSNILGGSIIRTYTRSFADLFLFFICINFLCGGSRVAMHLSPHWGPLDLRGVQSSLYVCSYVCFFASMFGYIRRFLIINFWKSFAQPCAQNMKPQATGLNHLSISIFYPSARLYGRLRAFCDLYLYQFPVWGFSVAMHL